MYKKNLGDWGEEIVAKELQKRGFKILARKFTTYYGEIDIVAKDKNEIVFIEVKTRSNTKYGEAIESISKYKLKNLIAATYIYLNRFKLENKPYRVDIATLDKIVHNKWRFRLIKNALA